MTIPQICPLFIHFNSTNINLFNKKMIAGQIFHICPKFHNSMMWMIFPLIIGENRLSKHFHSPNNNNKYIYLIFIYKSIYPYLYFLLILSYHSFARLYKLDNTTKFLYVHQGQLCAFIITEVYNEVYLQ